MKKNLKKVVALALSTVMLLSLAACGSKDTGATTDTATDTATDATTDTTTDTATDTTTDTAATGEIVNIKWITVGGGMPTNYDAWKANIDKYLGEKIGVNIDMEVVSWGDWENRRSVVVNANEEYDILFTNGNTFASDVNLGAFADITEIVKTASPDLYSFVPEDYWAAASVDGKIYAVPTYKDSSMTNYFVWDKAVVDDLKLDVSGIHELADAEPALLAMKEASGKAPFIAHKEGITSIAANYYDGLSLGLWPLGVKIDDETRTVVSVAEQPDVMEKLNLLHSWYKQGIINSDAATLAEAPKYRPFFIAQGWSGAAKTAWGPQMGVEAVAYQWADTILSNDTVQGSMNCISASSKNQEKALQLLQLVNTDSYVRDAFYYGLEGEDFNYTEDKKVEKLHEEWTMAGYTQGTFFEVSPRITEEFTQWDEVKQLNENATPSVMLGFSVDTKPIEDQLANCIEVYNRYKSELTTGTVDPAVAVPAMMKELEAAGFKEIVTEVQAQVDAAFK